jgi:hypothetical protein
MPQAACEVAKDVSFGVKMVQLLKENRVEAMIVTILLYSTGILEKAYNYGAGVC